MIALASVFLVGLWWLSAEFRSIRRNRQSQEISNAFPLLVEALVSTLQSGIGIVDAFKYVSEYPLPGFSRVLQEMVVKLDAGETLTTELSRFRASCANANVDYLVKLLAIANQNGGQFLIPALQNVAAQARLELSRLGETRGRQQAILATGKLGLLAPWILLAILSFNPSNREFYLSQSGNLLLLGGLSLSAVAYWMMTRAGRLPRLERVFEHG